MKKVFLLVAAAFVCMSANAQFQIGGKVGFDMTNFWGSGIEHRMKPGYQFGLIMEYKFNDRFAIAPEVVFASQGGKSKTKGLAFDVSDDFDVEDFSIADVDLTYTTNYINVPLMLKFYASPEFSIDFGPQVGFNVYSKAKAKGFDKPFDIKDVTNGVDFGLGLGATFNLTDNAFVQARYTMGLTKVLKDAKDKDFLDVEEYIYGKKIKNDAKNGNVQIAFGMKF